MLPFQEGQKQLQEGQKQYVTTCNNDGQFRHCHVFGILSMTLYYGPRAPGIP